MEKKIVMHTKPKFIKLITAMAYKNNDSKSSTVGDIVKKHFENLSDVEIKELLSTYDKLTQQEIKYPASCYKNPTQ